MKWKLFFFFIVKLLIKHSKSLQKFYHAIALEFFQKALWDFSCNIALNFVFIHSLGFRRCVKSNLRPWLKKWFTTNFLDANFSLIFATETGWSTFYCFLCNNELFFYLNKQSFSQTIEDGCSQCNVYVNFLNKFCIE